MVLEGYLGKIVAACYPEDSLIGSGSSKEKLQLVSYPSRRDTFEYGKTRRIKVKGCADINHVVRVDFYLLNGKDSLVKAVEEITQQ